MSLELLSSLGINPEKLQSFEDCFNGYHYICLEKPYYLDYCSQSLCNLLDYSAEELKLGFEDYSLIVGETDRKNYMDFLDNLSSKEQTLTLQYKMQKKDGTIIQIFDNATSRRMDDGKMYAFSVLSDIPRSSGSKPLGDLITSVVPYGFLQCTCEKYPKITYMNKPLLDYLYINEKPGRWEENAQENIYLLLPFEEREQFRLYMEKAQRTANPVRVDHHMFRSDGSISHLVGWMSMSQDDNGNDEFALLYRQIEEGPTEMEPIQNTPYFQVLKRSYNAIFNLNLETSMTELIHVLDESPVSSLFGVQMATDSAKQFFLNNYIFSEDCPMMKAYLDQITDPDDNWNEKALLQVDFRFKLPNGVFRYLGAAIHLDPKQVLLCCRNITDLPYHGAQFLENQILHNFYDWMDYLSTTEDDTLGMLMLDDGPEGCSLLYGSSSVLRYLALDSEESAHRSTPPSLDECLEAAGITQSDFAKLVAGKNLYLWSRTVPDAFQFQLTCKTYSRQNRKLYLLWCKKIILPESDSVSKRIFARTFGHFDLFLDNKPITFSSSKEKELMALLIDRNGGTLSPNDAISYLWEDEPADERTSSRYRKLAMGLKRTLTKYGIEDIIINHNGVRSVDTSAICCDYYELLAGNAKYRHAFHNAYMTDYSWSEETLATLWDYSDAT